MFMWALKLEQQPNGSGIACRGPPEVGGEHVVLRQVGGNLAQTVHVVAEADQAGGFPVPVFVGVADPSGAGDLGEVGPHGEKPLGPNPAWKSAGRSPDWRRRAEIRASLPERPSLVFAHRASVRSSAIAKRDASPRQVVGRQGDGNLVTGQDANVVLPHLAGDVPPGSRVRSPSRP